MAVLRERRRGLKKNDFWLATVGNRASSEHMGKASKPRRCPAIGLEISSSECATNRTSRYACPESCEHSPFAPSNYPKLVEIEDALDKKTLSWLFSDTSDRASMALDFRRAVETESPHAAHAFTSWRLYFQREADGLTCAHRWERAGFPGLKNDECVLFRAKMQARIALMEVRRVVDRQRLEVVDLFTGEGALIDVIDRSLASRSVRFSAFLAWIYPLPHFWRISGAAVAIPDWAPLEPLEIVTELARHLGGPIAPEPLRRWLAEHFVRLSDALDATTRERRRRTFAQGDDQRGSAVYELRAPSGECRVVLDRVDELDNDSLDGKETREGFAEARIWFDGGAGSPIQLPAWARPVLGRVLLGRASWRIEAMGGRLARLRGKLEDRLGDRVRFAGERVDGPGDRTATGGPQVIPALVPLRLVEQATAVQVMNRQVAAPADTPPEEMLQEIEEARLRALPDRQVPALGGRTPREAARDPALRPKLVRLIKSQVRGHDEKNLQLGRDADINWLLRELGLGELDVPPPPLRAPIGVETGGKAEPLEEQDGLPAEADDESGEPWPEPDPLPDRPFDPEEAARRLSIAFTEFDTTAEALNELDAGGATLLPCVRELTVDLLSETEFSCLLTFLLQAWFALVPPGRRAPRLRQSAMQEGLRRGMAVVTPTVLSGSLQSLQGVLPDCRQPGLLQALAERVFDDTKKMSKELRLSPGGRAAMVVVLEVVLNELDHALRQP